MVHVHIHHWPLLFPCNSKRGGDADADCETQNRGEGQAKAKSCCDKRHRKLATTAGLAWQRPVPTPKPPHSLLLFMHIDRHVRRIPKDTLRYALSRLRPSSLATFPDAMTIRHTILTLSGPRVRSNTSSLVFCAHSHLSSSPAGMAGLAILACDAGLGGCAAAGTAGTTGTVDAGGVLAGCAIA